MGATPQYSPGQDLPGTVYRVVRHLATGGMGSVYDVEDTTIGKRYVLKTLHPQLVAREDIARRMRDEARSLARLQHPNIVEIFTAGITTDDPPMPFYVMERLVGTNLRFVLDKNGPLRTLLALRVAIDVSDALEHAHDQMMVHRDVKPENIFLHRSPNGLTTTKLLDFGIVRMLDRKASFTNGKFIGTLRYASPEQIVGSSIGTGTDIYSLGAVLFEMIAGRGPFDDAGDGYAIGAAHAQVPAPPLSRFAPRVAPELEALVAAMLAKDPAARPPDCFTVGRELRRLYAGEEAGPPASATEVNVISGSVTAGGPTVATAPTQVAVATEAETRGEGPGGAPAAAAAPPPTPPVATPTRVVPSPVDATLVLEVAPAASANAIGSAPTMESDPRPTMEAAPTMASAGTPPMGVLAPGRGKRPITKRMPRGKGGTEAGDQNSFRMGDLDPRPGVDDAVNPTGPTLALDPGPSLAPPQARSAFADGAARPVDRNAPTNVPAPGSMPHARPSGDTMLEAPPAPPVAAAAVYAYPAPPPPAPLGTAITTEPVTFAPRPTSSSRAPVLVAAVSGAAALLLLGGLAVARVAHRGSAVAPPAAASTLPASTTAAPKSSPPSEPSAKPLEAKPAEAPPAEPAKRGAAPRPKGSTGAGYVNLD